jgi:hypothetical protein
MNRLDAVDELNSNVRLLGGVFYYRHNGKVAGRITKTGYRFLSIRFSGVRYNINASHLSFYKHFRVLPVLPIDHIDGNKDNNRISNIREVSISQNMLNRPKINKSSSSKYVGVHWNKKYKIWKSSIQYKGVYYYCGKYRTEIEAFEARIAMSKDMDIYQFLYAPNS